MEQPMAKKAKICLDQLTKPSAQIEATSSAIRSLVEQIQELDTDFGSISQGFQSILDKILH